MLKKLLAICGFMILSAQADASMANSFLVEATALQPATLNLTGTYYDQFLYQVMGDCKKIETVWIHSTHAWEQAMLGKDSQGRPALAGASVQLFQDGTYYAEYEELAIKEVTSTDTHYDILFAKVIEGKWSVSGDQLLIQGLGIGTPNKMILPSGAIADSIKFQMNTAINDKRVLNVAMNIGKSSTNNGPRGISINKYCGIN